MDRKIRGRWALLMLLAMIPILYAMAGSKESYGIDPNAGLRLQETGSLGPPARRNVYQEAVESWIADLQEAKAIEDLDGVTNGMVTSRDEFILGLRRLLWRRTDEQGQIRIVYLLGELRALEAVGEIVDRITLEDKNWLEGSDGIVPELTGSLPRWTRYPAQDALLKLGTRAIPSVVRKIGDSDDKITRRLCAQAIWRILGGACERGVEGKELAYHLVASYAAKEEYPVKRDRLRSVLVYFKPLASRPVEPLYGNVSSGDAIQD